MFVYVNYYVYISNIYKCLLTKLNFYEKLILHVDGFVFFFYGGFM